MQPLYDGMKLFLFMGLTCLSRMLCAEHVVIESLNGESYAFEVNSEDTFLDVVHAIESLDQESFLSDERTFGEEIHVFKINIGGRKALSNTLLAKKIRTEARNYAAGISASESTDITYILKTMANSSLPKIKSAETSLKKAGDRIDHVHPFYFLACIFTNEELKVCIRNLQGRAWVWKEFLKGITDSLAEEDAQGNLLPFVEDFSAKLKVDANVILPILKSGRWERFVNTLIDIVPREGGANRYNM